MNILCIINYIIYYVLYVKKGEKFASHRGVRILKLHPLWNGIHRVAYYLIKKMIKHEPPQHNKFPRKRGRIPAHARYFHRKVVKWDLLVVSPQKQEFRQAAEEGA